LCISWINKKDLRSSLFCDVPQQNWSLVIDVSRQPVSPTLKGQAAQEEEFKLL